MKNDQKLACELLGGIISGGGSGRRTVGGDDCSEGVVGPEVDEGILVVSVSAYP